MKIKRLFQFTLLMSCLVLSGPAVMLLPTGCANPSHQKLAVQTLGSIHKATDATYKGYITLVLQGHLSESGVAPASEAYRQFQSVFGEAVILVRGNTNAAVPQSVFDAAAKVSSTVETLKAKGLK